MTACALDCLKSNCAFIFNDPINASQSTSLQRERWRLSQISKKAFGGGSTAGTLQGVGRLTLQARHWIHDSYRFAAIAK